MCSPPGPALGADRSAVPGDSGLFAARQLASQPVEFLALLVGHVPLRYEVTLRSYGALSSTFRKRVGWLEAPPVCEPPVAAEDDEGDFAKERRRNWGKLIAEVYLDDPELCSACGERMKIVAAIPSSHQDEIIERVLRHLNLREPALEA